MLIKPFKEVIINKRFSTIIVVSSTIVIKRVIVINIRGLIRRIKTDFRGKKTIFLVGEQEKEE